MTDVSTYKKYFNETIQPEDIKYSTDLQKHTSMQKKNVLEYIGSYDVEGNDKNKVKSEYNSLSRNEKVINLLLLQIFLNETTFCMNQRLC